MKIEVEIDDAKVVRLVDLQVKAMFEKDHYGQGEAYAEIKRQAIKSVEQVDFGVFIARAIESQTQSTVDAVIRDLIKSRAKVIAKEKIAAGDLFEKPA